MYVYAIWMVWGKKLIKLGKLKFLRYPTGGSGMISELFFWRPIEKFLCSRYAISFWRSLKGGWSHAKIQENSRKIPEISRKIPGKFPDILRKISRHPRGMDNICGGCPQHRGVGNMRGCVWEPPWNFKFNYLEMSKMMHFDVYFLPASYDIW